MSPPREKGVDVAGWELACWPEVGVDPKPSGDGLFVGVEFARLNKEDFDPAEVVCPAPPPNMLLLVAGEGCAGVLVVVSEPPAVLPKLKPLPEPPAPENRPEEGVDVAGGFAAPPNKLPPVPDVVPDCEERLPKTLFPGGGPAGVVEGRNEVLLGAGVAAGVDDPKNCG